MQTETKVNIIVALILIVTAFFNLQIASGLAVIYLIVYAIRRLRKSRPT